LFYISSKTISKVIVEVCKSIIKVLGPIHMSLPSCAEEWIKIAQNFERIKKLPHCLGAIDGKHISKFLLKIYFNLFVHLFFFVEITRPPHAGSTYFNYKKHDSIVLLGISDARHRFVWVEAGIEGRISDGGVWNHSEFKQRYLDQGLIKLPQHSLRYFFIGDDAFPLSETIIKPFK
jgi:hypothetical protein